MIRYAKPYFSLSLSLRTKEKKGKEKKGAVAERMRVHFSAFWELLGEGEGEGELSRFGRGTSKISELISFYLLANGSTRAEMMKKGEVKRAGHRCSL